MPIRSGQETGPGWGGDGTRQIVLYRSDRIPLVRPYGQSDRTAA
jgi:hypothetical protein